MRTFRSLLVTTLLIAFVLAAPWGAARADTLVLGHSTDEHITTSGQVAAVRLRAIVRAMNAQAQAWVSSGDVTNNGYASQWTVYRNIMAAATIPWRAVPGNHDTSWPLGAKEWFFDLVGYRIIGLNARGINWAALDLALQTSALPKVVVGHLPIEAFSGADATKLKTRFQRYGVLLYLAGHVAYDSVKVINGVTYVTGNKASLGHYRLIRLDGLQVTIELRTAY